MMTLTNFAVVFLGGGLGACLRFLLSCQFLRLNLSVWPATLLANIIGVIVFFIVGRKFPESGLLFKVGFAGGLTTFSTFIFEIVDTLQRADYKTALAIFLLNMLSGVFIGIWVIR